MIKKLKNNKGFSVKELVFVIIAIIFAFSIGFGLSYIISNNAKNSYIDEISRLRNQIKNSQNTEEQDDVQDEENEENNEEISIEATVWENYYNAMTIADEFDYKEIENNEESEILNYKELIENSFTKNGQKIFEEENKGYIQFKDGKAYITTQEEDTNDYLVEVDFEDIEQSEDTISATVVRKMAKEKITNMTDEEIEKIETYELKDELILKKEGEKWLVDKYSWVIKK